MLYATWLINLSYQGFPGCSDGKESAFSAEDPGSTPGSGRSPGEGNSNLLQYSSVASLWVRQLSVRLQCGRAGFNPWVGKIPWRRKWQSTPVLLPGKSHGQRRLVGTFHGITKSRTRLSNFTFFPVLLLGKSHRQRKRIGYSPPGCKESDMTY